MTTRPTIIPRVKTPGSKPANRNRAWDPSQGERPDLRARLQGHLDDMADVLVDIAFDAQAHNRDRLAAIKLAHDLAAPPTEGLAGSDALDRVARALEGPDEAGEAGEPSEELDDHAHELDELDRDD